MKRTFNKKFFLIVMLIGAALFAAFRTSTAAAEVYNSGVVYVVYSKTGEDAVPSTDDNNNGVPDMVENVATQVNATRELFHDIYEYPDPLKSKRYKGINSIEVVIVNREKIKHNGLAFSSANHKSRRDPNERVLLLKVASSVTTENVTLTHEYFHLIQYGITRFGNGWFLEGMANWSHDAIQKTKNYPSKGVSSKLDDKAYVDKLFEVKYSASKLLWYPLAVECGDYEKIPKSLIKKYRYVDGSPVFKDAVFYGPHVMLDILKKLPEKEAEAIKAYGNRSKWINNATKSKDNDALILESVREYVEEHRKDD